MAETTAEAPASTEAGIQEAASETAAALAKKEISIRDMLEAGVHFGHQTRRWNPRMKEFLFGERNGIHIIDLDQSLPMFRRAIDFIRETVASGNRVLFVATKRQAQSIIELESVRAGQFYVNNRWLGGMLTNFKTVKKSIERYKVLLELFADEEKLSEISKKEQARASRWIDKYTKSLAGIKEMVKLPGAVIVMDINREMIAVKEAQRLGIPIVAVVDSNCDPYGIDYVIPGNDDSIRALSLYAARFADACLEGAAEFNERAQSEAKPDESAPARSSDQIPTKTGRVVVEIKQQPRRGKSAAAAAVAREEAAREAAAAASSAVAEPAAPPAETETKPAE